MLIEGFWWLITRIATGMDFALTISTPGNWERPITNAINNVGLGLLGALRPALNSSAWLALVSFFFSALLVRIVVLTMDLVKLVRKWFP